MKGFIEVPDYHGGQMKLVALSQISRVEPGSYANRGNYIILQGGAHVQTTDSYDTIKQKMEEAS